VPNFNGGWAEVGLTGRLRVGEWRVAPELNSLERDGQSVRVEPKIMQVLVTLAERPGTVLTKEHILRQVWPETFVSEEVLTRSISELRRVFEDNPREPTYIQTIPKGGYRLLAPVVTEGPDRQTISMRWREGKKWGLAIPVAVVLVGALSFHFINRRQHTESRSSDLLAGGAPADQSFW
jgi:DNA-binding winged helix-turn-helix (wHTH) protein